MKDQIKELIKSYEEMKFDKKRARIDVQARFAPMIEESLSKEILAIETRFGKQLVAALNAGVARQDIEMPVLKSKGGRYNHFVELGGGEIREKLSAEERALKQLEAERFRLEINRQKRDIRAGVRDEQKRIDLLASVGLEPAAEWEEYPYRVAGTDELAEIHLDDYNTAMFGRAAYIRVPGDFELQTSLNENTKAWSVKVRDVFLFDNPDQVIANEGRGKK